MFLAAAFHGTTVLWYLENMAAAITLVQFFFRRRLRMEGMKYCIVRTYSAGVFAGYIEYRKDQEVVLREARRIWYWEGAATLSQLAQSGTSLPEKCKFPEPVDRITVLGTIEILDCTEKAKASIDSVPIWRA